MNEYNPDYVTAPAETIRELLDERDVSYSSLTIALEISSEDTFDLLNGRLILNKEIAHKLEELFDVPASLWLNLENNYRA